MAGTGYERPYTGKQMLEHGYDPALVRRLMADPVHKWRAKTGIELIHREPDLKEAIRVWVNWNRMSKRDKARSDHRSMKLFGVDNKTHYEQLRPLYKESQAYLRGFIGTLAKCAAAQPLTPPASRYRPPAGVPAPRPAQPVRASVPQMGVRTVGYGDGAATAPAGTFEARHAAGADAGAQAVRQKSRGIPDAAAMRTARNAGSAGAYAVRGLNYLASHPEFQRRAGNGDLDAGRASVAEAAHDLASVPVVNETPRSGAVRFAAMAYTRGGDRSYVAMPAATVARRGAYRGTGEWRNGIMSHELSHPFANKVRGYVDKIKRIQQEEGIQGTDQYHRTPKEQAAEFNALRIMKGAWPGGGAGPGGAYTPEQADSILDNGNPYFRGLPVNYKMRLLNEARNRRPAQYGAPRRAMA